MKKIIFFIIAILLLFSYKKNENTQLISNNIEDNVFDIYLLKTNINTKEIFKYINNEIQIIEIYPKIKLNYNLNLKKYSYKFTTANNKSNINLFINEYRRLLINNNYINDANMVGFKGIDIEKIKVSTNEKNIVNLLKTKKFTLN